MNGSPPSASTNAPSETRDDISAAFPNMDLFHDLRIACTQSWPVLAELMTLLDLAGAKLCSLSAHRYDSGQLSIKCRLSALSSDAASAVAHDLSVLSGVTSANVEHILLCARSRPNTARGRAVRSSS